MYALELANLVLFLSTLSLRRATIILIALFTPPIFLSTLSLRRATNVRLGTRQPCAISIHALLAESDALAPEENPTQKNFYPRSPCGERQTEAHTMKKAELFLSTLSLRRATASQTNLPG